MNKTYLFRVERGTTVPTLTRLHVLSRIYRVKLSTLVDILEQARLEQKRASVPKVDLSVTSFEELRTKAIEAEKGGDYPRAVQLFQAAWDYATQEAPSADRSLRIVTARHDLSIALRNSGEWEIAREVAEDVFEENALPDDLRDRVRLNLAVIYRRLAQPVLAREILLGLQDRKSEVSPRILAFVYQEMGSLAMEAHPKEAAGYYRSALAVQRKLKSKIDICKLLGNIGVAEMNAGKLDTSMEVLRRAQYLARSGQFHRCEAHATWAMGKNAYMRRDFEVAKDHFRDCQRLSEAGDYYDLLFACHFYLREIAVAQGDSPAVRAHQAGLRFFSKQVHEPIEELEKYRRERP